MNIHLMAESEVFKKDYKYPVSKGVFYGTLQGASWATHSILHTYSVYVPLLNAFKSELERKRDIMI